MTYEGLLYMLLNYDEYEVRKEDISFEAWEEIFKLTDLLEFYLKEKFGCYDVLDFFDQVLTGVFLGWDSSIFDTWEEYLEMIKGTSYVDYLKDMKIEDFFKLEKVNSLWEHIVDDSKKEFIRECGYIDEIYLPKIAEHIHLGFIEIFYRYGLPYEMIAEWGLSC